MRNEIKVYENTFGIKIVYDINNQEIIDTDDSYKSPVFKRYNIRDIIYDDRMICCFYIMEDHPHRHNFSENFINFAKMFTHYGLTVILDRIENQIATILVYPTEKVKTFKT